MVSASAETSLSVSAFRSVPSSSTAQSTPSRLPLPPKIETPPSSTAATTASSRPTPLSARALAKRKRADDAGERGDHAGDDEQPELDAA